MKKLGIYIHIPFCARKCNYCDFLSEGNAPDSRKNSYMKSLADEIRWYASGAGKAGGSWIDTREYEVDTVFVGGGTPSLIAPDMLCSLLDCVRQNFRLNGGAEISLEANPGTVNRESLTAYRMAGFNRISFGVQSFDDRILKILGRIHDANDAFACFRQAREAGFDNINMDLMFGIPGQSMDHWIATMARTLELAPEHISFYSLKFEEGTPFYDMLQSGAIQEAEDILDRNMYASALEMLKSPSPGGDRPAYIHYEISNAALEGFCCRHNLKYWSMEEYLGLGLGSHSYMNGERFSNECDIQTYLSSSGGRVAWRHQNSTDDEISEYIFTGLRKIEGIRLQDYVERFGESIQKRFASELDELSGRRLIELSQDRLKLTPEGIDISNTVLSHFV